MNKTSDNAGKHHGKTVPSQTALTTATTIDNSTSNINNDNTHKQKKTLRSSSVYSCLFDRTHDHVDHHRTWNKTSSAHFTSASILSGKGYGSVQPSSMPSGALISPRLTKYAKYHSPETESVKNRSEIFALS